MLDMARQFLVDFSTPTAPVAAVMQNFNPAYAGTAKEWSDVEFNRATRRIVNYRIDAGRATLAPGGACEYRHRTADACTYFLIEWWSEVIGPAGDPNMGRIEYVSGLDQVTAIRADGRWWLTGSDWIGSSYRLE